MKRNILLTISYDGTNFSGWQRQPDRLTVQGHLEEVLSKLFRTEILIDGTSRTDAGVHALGQRASFQMDVNIPIEKLPMVVNNALASYEKGAYAISPVRIAEAEEKPLDFHARFDSKGKKYIYKIRNTRDVDLFQRNYVYHVPHELDLDAIRKAAKLIEGTHDFKCFEASGSNERETTVRTIYALDVVTRESCPEEIEFHVSGDGFLYNMVRIITGTLVDVGTGRISPESITEIIEAKDRRNAGHTAPPYGLYLAEVFY